jgi:hypothetical protein
VPPRRLERRAADWLESVGAVIARLGRECTPAALWQRHRLFTIAIVLSLVPRILAILAYRPAQMTSDSMLYMAEAVTGRLGKIRPGGYPGFLSLFRGLPHPLLLVTTTQHLMGLAVAVIVYGLLRYWGLPGWGACLAALPTLFDAREISLESYVLPDMLFCLVVVAATALLLSRRAPRPWQCVAAALLLSYAALLRGNGLPLAAVALVFLLIRRVGWKALTAAAVTFAIPLTWYVMAFHAEYHEYNLTESDGIFLWSRTTTFADCARLKMPGHLKPLCPNREKLIAPANPTPAWSVTSLATAQQPTDYLWAADAYWRIDKYPGFNPYNNKLGTEFAERAIAGDPVGYARVVTENVLSTFLATDRLKGGAYMTFIQGPRIPLLPAYYTKDVEAYAGTGNTRSVEPYTYFLLLYQEPVQFPGLVFLAVVLAGLVFVLKDWRRFGGMQLLPWGMAAMSILTPAMLTQSLYRYVIVAIPLSCLALGLGIASARARSRVPNLPPARLARPLAAAEAPGGPGGERR